MKFLVKPLAIAMCIIMFLVLVACADGDSEASFSNSGVSTQPTETRTVATTTTEEAATTATALKLSYEEAKVKLDELFRYIGTSDDVAGLLSVESPNDSPTVLLFIAKVNSKNEVGVVKDALRESARYIKEETQVGLLDDVSYGRTLQIGKFDRHHRDEFGESVRALYCTHDEMSAYREIVTGLEVLVSIKEALPSARPVIVVVTEGFCDYGNSLSNIAPIAEGIGIPIYTAILKAEYYSDNDLAGVKELSQLTNARCVETDSDNFVEDFLSLLKDIRQ